MIKLTITMIKTTVIFNADMINITITMIKIMVILNIVMIMITIIMMKSQPEGAGRRGRRRGGLATPIDAAEAGRLLVSGTVSSSH